MNDRQQGDRRRRLDSVISELVKRAVEIGVEKAVEAPENIKELVGGIKLPREAVQYLLSQIEDTKNGISRVVASEVRDFLEHSNVASEMQKMLSTMQLEIRTTIRFKPAVLDATASDSETGRLKPEVNSEVQVKRAARTADRGEVADPGGGLRSEELSRERRRSRE
jgi:hypothetical protein